MRCVWALFSVLIVGGAIAGPEGAMLRASRSLLSVQKFPKTFNDLSFVERTAVLAAGYEPWESEYDASGRCISGCAYPGITIEDELSAMRRQTERAVRELQDEGLLPQPEQPQKPELPQRPEPPVLPEPPQRLEPPQRPEPPVLPEPPQRPEPQCSPRQSEIRFNQGVPIGEPLVGRPRITSPFGERIHPITKKRQTHKGIDFAVPSGTDVFSPAMGTVVDAWTDNTCGVALKIKHDNGYETVYCHLSRQLVRRGDNVGAGCRIALSGNTGRSTGPHLHYGVKKDGTYIDPAKLIGR